MDSKKGGYVCKGGKIPDKNDLAVINTYTRREFKAGELYTFPVVLCDNEADRDGERFSLSAIEKLSQLFVGKTGVLNHDVKAQNQTARIYSCRVEKDGSRRTSCGETYTRLLGMAYMPKTNGNSDFITELDSGIKKEVSVGCAVSKVTCSVCGADLKNSRCEHERGKTYGGVVCCAVLDEPTDAYEWSFVAVPAQREAGVIKTYDGKGVKDTEDILKKLEKAESGVTLTKEQCGELLAKAAALEKDAAAGRAYREMTEKDFVRYAVMAHPLIPEETVKRAASGIGIKDMECFTDAFKRQAGKELPVTPQLMPAARGSGDDENAQFKI